MERRKDGGREGDRGGGGERERERETEVSSLIRKDLKPCPK